MTLHRTTNIMLASIIAVMLSTAYLLDGPSDLDALQASVDSKQDAIKTAATHARTTSVRGQKEHKLMIAQAAP